MKETFKKSQGFKFYVYVGPGNISYFYDYESAKSFADSCDCEVQEMF